MRPRQLLPGGYISFVNLQTNELEQILWVNPGPPQYNVLGPAPSNMALRVWVDGKMEEYKKKIKHERELNDTLLSECVEHRTNLSKIATERGKLFKSLHGK